MEHLTWSFALQACTHVYLYTHKYVHDNQYFLKGFSDFAVNVLSLLLNPVFWFCVFPYDPDLCKMPLHQQWVPEHLSQYVSLPWHLLFLLSVNLFCSSPSLWREIWVCDSFVCHFLSSPETMRAGTLVLAPCYVSSNDWHILCVP